MASEWTARQLGRKGELVRDSELGLGVTPRSEDTGAEGVGCERDTIEACEGADDEDGASTGGLRV